MKIGDTLIEVEKIGERSETLASLQQTLPYTDCRFILFDLEYQSADRGLQSKLWFISWFPHNAGTYAKMAYTSAKQKLIELMPGVNDTMARSVEELAINLGVSKAEDEDSDMDL
jgi:hypothetical protein